MTRVIKTLLLWLLMAALPLQGLAAVMKASCGPAHHAGVPAAMLAEGHHHDHAGGDHHHHHDFAQHAAAGGAHADNTDDATDSASAASTINTSSYCSACAACCVGAVAPPSVTLWTPGDAAAETIFIAPASLVTGHIPAGLERPPRKISA